MNAQYPFSSATKDRATYIDSMSGHEIISDEELLFKYSPLTSMINSSGETIPTRNVISNLKNNNADDSYNGDDGDYDDDAASTTSSNYESEENGENKESAKVMSKTHSKTNSALYNRHSRTQSAVSTVYANPYTKGRKSSGLIETNNEFSGQYEKRVSIFSNWGINDDINHNKRNSIIIQDLITNNKSLESIYSHEQQQEPAKLDTKADTQQIFNSSEAKIIPHSPSSRNNSLRRRATYASRSIKRLKSIRESSENSGPESLVQTNESSNSSLKRTNATRRKFGWLSSLILLFQKLKANASKKWRSLTRRKTYKFRGHKNKETKKVNISGPILISTTAKSEASGNKLKLLPSETIYGQSVKSQSVHISTERAPDVSEKSANKTEVQEAAITNLNPDLERIIELWSHFLKTSISNRIQIKLEIETKLNTDKRKVSRTIGFDESLNSQLYLDKPKTTQFGSIIHSKRESIFDSILSDYLSTCSSDENSLEEEYDGSSSISSFSSVDESVPMINIIEATPKLSGDFYSKKENEINQSIARKLSGASVPTSPLSSKSIDLHEFHYRRLGAFSDAKDSSDVKLRDSIFSYDESDSPAIIIDDHPNRGVSAKPSQRAKSYDDAMNTKAFTRTFSKEETHHNTATPSENENGDSNFDAFSFQYSLVDEETETDSDEEDLQSSSGSGNSTNYTYRFNKSYGDRTELHYTYSNDTNYQYQLKQQMTKDYQLSKAFAIGDNNGRRGTENSQDSRESKPSHRLLKQIERYMGGNKKTAV
ncbi:hypothetical protein CANARDRAFT_24954 [[Candida] arabinofermentans NRRL YB-2248]|uniref:Uncharacterized protein n=1 Tax=[Candida] arabinofermentans NRRL YB-2248 TaxID=983967 RepID=A0A1E4SVE7_9ASCO|nr:hypothetical protein CANARDRAFT_24954 [[Candida] arabinofermentans NRRL YB-2248]